MTQEIPLTNREDDSLPDLPWTLVRLWTMSAVIGLGIGVVAAAGVGDGRWVVPIAMWVGMVSIWLLAKVARSANAFVLEQDAAAQEIAAEQKRAARAAREQSEVERVAAEAAALRGAAAAREAEQAQAAAAAREAERILFEDLVQEAYKRMGEGKRSE